MSTRCESATVAPPSIVRTRLTVGSTKTTRSPRGRAMTDMCMSSTGLVIGQWLQTQGLRPKPSVEAFEHVRVHRVAFALQRYRAQPADARAGQRAQRARADGDGADGRRALQPRGDVHGVADHRVALALVRADDADH